MPKLEPFADDYYLWEYVPSIALSIIFLLLFLAPTIFHIRKAWETRARFCISFIIGGILEVTGFAIRAACTYATANLPLYILQSVLILLGPVLFAASIYMVLARLIRSVNGEKYSLIRITRLTKTFVAGDILSFLVQGQGSGLMASEGTQGIAKGITIGGLLIQIFVFGFFLFTAVMFEKRMKRAPTSEVPYTQHLYPLYAVSWLVMLRSVFRVLEYALGQKGYLLANEWPLFVFDAVPMVGVMLIWAVRHPGTIQVGQRRSLRMGDYRNVV
ncbi:hypothetical protein BDW74DRAFT_182192 [Aspergillus multicolor]|uniref:RTA1 domain-containing protein n=1 Tax=Aspergillus multicolor TaxID=41759 RepID=UPI003CCCF900